MKKLLLVLAIGAFVACNNETAPEGEGKDSTTTVAPAPPAPSGDSTTTTPGDSTANAGDSTKK